MDPVVVSVADGQELPAVLAALRRAGMVVEDVLEPLGMVTGSIDPEALGSLRAVPGVSHVERRRGFQLPPPASPT